MELGKVNVKVFIVKGWKVLEVFIVIGWDGKIKIYGVFWKFINFNFVKKYFVIDYSYIGLYI